jgi:hypothetical protein
VLTFIPVFADVGPTNLYPKHDGWYVGDDIIRIIEPIGGLVIHMCILWVLLLLNSLFTYLISYSFILLGKWNI